MMPPSQRFLGVPAGSPPRRLLGLPEGPLTLEEIDRALARQRERVDRHPASRDESAERLRRELTAAAQLLIASRVAPTDPPKDRPVKPVELSRPRTTRPAPRPRRPRDADLPDESELTEFDRLVLATLATSGGWNRESRARLASVASRYGVSGAGLGKVIVGLARMASAGGISQRTTVTSAVAELASRRPVEPSRLTRAFEQLDEALAREVAADTPARLVRLLGVFVGVAVIGAYLLVQALSGPSTPSRATTKREAAPIVTAEEASRRVEPPVAPAQELDRPGIVRPARYPKPPTFRGAQPSKEMRDALAATVTLPERLGTLVRKLQLSANRPSEAAWREWVDMQRSLGLSWPLMDPSSRAQAIEGSVAALKPMESDDVAARFVSVWSTGLNQADRAGGVWEGAWAAGMLAEVAARQGMSAAVAAPAIDELVAVVPRRALLREKGAALFDSAAGAWLDQAAVPLVRDVATNADALERWERWIDAMRAVRSGAALQEAYLDAIGEVLRGTNNIAEAGEGADLLGRLIESVDWTERSPDPQRARDAITLWFTDTGIAADRLWVLTSLLDASYDTAWFLPEFVVDPTADLIARGKLLDRITAAWPETTGRAAAVGAGIAVDARDHGRWGAALAQVASMPAGNDAASLVQALQYARLSTAAQAFAADVPESAVMLIGDVERELTQPQDFRTVAGARPGRPSGSDGEFAAAYEEAGRDEERRKEELRALRSRPAAGDLGPRDAELLVEEALRATPADVRILAQSVIVDRFADGPTVLQELLDHLPTAPQIDPTSSLVERVTGTKLPASRSPDWMRAARLALVRKLLSFMSSDRHAVDAVAERLAETLVDRSRLVRVGFDEPGVAIPADRALARVADQWRLRASSIFLSDPYPAPLEELDHRRQVRLELAEGPVQRYVAEQSALIDYMAAVAIAEEPELRPKVAAIVEEATRRRGRATGAVEQLLDGERVIARLYELLLRPRNGARPERMNEVTT